MSVNPYTGKEKLLWPPLCMDGMPSCLTGTLSFSHAVLGDHRTELNFATCSEVSQI